MNPPARALWKGRAIALAGILLMALALRIAVASLSPVIAQISADFTLPAFIIGLIGTAPPVCFAIFGIITPQIERRFGLERTALAAIIVVLLGLISRGLAFDAMSLLGATTLIFVGVGAGNILLPPLVKKYFPDRIGLMTSLYTTAMAVATFIPPLVAVPLADAAGWRFSLGLWAVFGAIAVVPWVLMVVRSRAGADAGAEGLIAQPDGRVFRRLAGLPLTWAIGVGFGVSSATVYTAYAWLPSILIDVAGVSPAEAGVLLALFSVMAFPTSILVPLLITRFNALVPLLVTAAVTGFAGLAGLIFAPAAAPALWVVLYGTTPLLFPMMLMLIGLRTRTHQTAVALSGFVQGIGYGIAALFPFMLGVIHDATDSWTLPLWILTGIIAVIIPVGLVIARPRTIEQDWERRHGAW